MNPQIISGVVQEFFEARARGHGETLRRFAMEAKNGVIGQSTTRRIGSARRITFAPGVRPEDVEIALLSGKEGPAVLA